jgi:hypothetical protein
MNIIIKYTPIILIFFTFINCSNSENEDECNINYSYSIDVSSIVNNKCSSAGCHNSDFGGDFGSYEGVMEKVNSGEFYKEINEGTMPPVSKPQLTNEELMILKCWSLNGGNK